MLTKWQFNVLFVVGVAGAVALLVGPEFGFNFSSNPTAVAGIGAILTYVLTQKPTLTKNHKKDDPDKGPPQTSKEGEDDAVE